MFYRYFPLWKTFFEALGWRVVVSEGLGKRGKLHYLEDSCLPMKLLVTHAIHLKEKAVDHLFIPRLVSLHRSYILCPKFRAAPDVVRLALEGGISILDETIDLREREYSLPRSFLVIGRRLGASEKEARKAFQKAETFFHEFQKGWERRINGLSTKELFDLERRTPEEVEDKPFRVALIGHPYNLFDPDINKDILTYAKSLGMGLVTSEGLPEKEIERQVGGLSKEIYWSSGREIVGALFHFLTTGVDGILFLTSFKCGIDALLQELIRRRLKRNEQASPPVLFLTLDEHSAREGWITRLEAFREVMEARKKG
ncbi:MAG: acyl-CoA dehydratase activase-related protein [Desulfobacterota bacterium]|nr:acyl-CoA dehydratase activase-related protein [Thermodesulfobacteriota bacterium]